MDFRSSSECDGDLDGMDDANPERCAASDEEEK
jgi:hypothetical protein